MYNVKLLGLKGKLMKRKNEKIKACVKLLYKSLMISIAFFSAIILWYWNISSGWDEGYNGYFTLVCVGLLYCIIYWFLAKMYEAQKIGLYRLTELVYFQFLAFAIADVALFVESVFWFHGFEKLNIMSFVIVLLAQLLAVTGIIFICNRIFARFDAPRKIMIVYGDKSYVDLVTKVNRKKYRYHIEICISEDSPIDEIKRRIDECESIYLYGVHSELRKELVIYCDSMKKNIYLTQDLDDLIIRGFDVSHTFDIPLVRSKKEPVKWYYPFVKRMGDILCSVLALVVLSPVFIIVAVLIKCHDGGPVFYKQVRLTKGHREFEIYKFRSMIVDAEKHGVQLASQNDDRVTPIGKIIRMTRIDELPQLINIFKGDMSIVGPRPERPEIEKEYLKDLPEFGLRLQVPAGLTGYAQVFGKYNTTALNKLKFDLLYIKQRSLFLDLKLIFYTIKIIFIPESTEGVEETITYNADEGKKYE